MNNAGKRIPRIRNRRKLVLWAMDAIILAAAAMVLTADSFHRSHAGDSAAPVSAMDAQLVDRLYAQRTEYIGNNSKVGAILNLLPYPVGVLLTGFELQTEEAPYGVVAQLTSTPDYRGGEPAALLQWRFCSALLLALVGNADWVRFDVAQDGHDQHLLFDLASVSLDYSLIPYIRGKQDAYNDFYSLAIVGPSIDNAFYLLHSTGAGGAGPLVTVQPGERGCTALSDLFYAYYAAADTAVLPDAAEYVVSLHYDETWGSQNLFLSKDANGRTWAQMDGGAVRPLDASIYHEMEALYAPYAAARMEAAPPAVTPALPPATPNPSGPAIPRLTLMDHGAVLSERMSFADADKEVMGSLISRYLLSSTRWAPVDVNRLSRYWRLESPEEMPEYRVCYFFVLDGDACVQNDTLRRRVKVPQEYMDAVIALLPSGPAAANEIPPKFQRYEISRLSRGREVARRDRYTVEDRRVLDFLLSEHLSAAATLPAQDVDELDECWRIRYFRDGQALPTELYAFSPDGDGWIQSGNDGPRTNAGDWYWHLAGLIP